MKKIALVLPEAGPVPAVRGGAIEELLTILVEQNEIEHRVQFIVFCADNEQARAIAEKYKYSKIIYLPKTTLADRLINRVIRYSNRIIKNKTWIDIAYYRRVFRYLKNIDRMQLLQKVDYIMNLNVLHRNSEKKMYIFIFTITFCASHILIIFTEV